MKKKLILILTVALMLVCMTGLNSYAAAETTSQDEKAVTESGLELHKIGVPTYNVNDPEIRMFKTYLDSYIKECFPDVTFVYPGSLSGQEELMGFLQECADIGVEGIFAILSYDVEEEVNFCAENNMFYVRATGTTAQEKFDAVADNPYYVGEIGPGTELEYQAGADMVSSMVDLESDDTYLIFSSGASMGNEMHRLRTIGILEKLAELYGVTYEEKAEKLASVNEITHIEAGKLKLDICPGYLEIPAIEEAAIKCVNSGMDNVVLSVVPVTAVVSDLDNMKIRYGVIDCFSEENRMEFQKGNIEFVAGKYPSEIGPAFAALYNALTGHAGVFRDNGKAFRLQQGFWNAYGANEYEEKYDLASGTYVTAYNYEDLYNVVVNMNPEVTFKDFKALTESYTYEACLERRE